MNNVIVPQGYKAPLNAYNMQRAIVCVKDNFQYQLSRALNLKRVSAPLFVSESSGLNDNLNGIERPVAFDVTFTGQEAQIVHSLAKWKRYALSQYGFGLGEGLYADMNAVRRDEPVLDNMHSVYVDQWDWEKIITRENRNIDFLKIVVNCIVRAICDTSEIVNTCYPQVRTRLERDVSFITSQELLDMYPDLDTKARENMYVKDHPTACVLQIGGALSSGLPHEGRAPDYDDWDLNCDIFFWNDVLGCAMEISSMGIRVDSESLKSQLERAGCPERENLPFHKMILSGELPLTIGGGIGQSRLCMLIMGCAHIGEVQVSVWDEETIEVCSRAGIHLL